MFLGLVGARRGWACVFGAKVQDWLGECSRRSRRRTPPGSRRCCRSASFRFYTVTGDFPKRAPQDYRLTVNGLVDKPFTLTYDELRAMPPTMLTTDFQCVTGWRVPDVQWTGVLLRDLLDRAGVKPEAKALRFVVVRRRRTPRASRSTQARRADVIVAYELEGKPLSQRSRRAGAALRRADVRLQVVQVARAASRSSTA